MTPSAILSSLRYRWQTLERQLNNSYVDDARNTLSKLFKYVLQNLENNSPKVIKEVVQETGKVALPIISMLMLSNKGIPNITSAIQSHYRKEFEETIERNESKNEMMGINDENEICEWTGIVDRVILSGDENEFQVTLFKLRWKTKQGDTTDWRTRVWLNPISLKTHEEEMKKRLGVTTLEYPETIFDLKSFYMRMVKNEILIQIDSLYEESLLLVNSGNVTQLNWNLDTLNKWLRVVKNGKEKRKGDKK